MTPKRGRFAELRRNLSLRIKLTAWYLFVFAFVQVTVLSAVLWFRRDNIQRADDDRLQRSAEVIARRIAEQGLPTTRAGFAGLAGDEAVVLLAIRDRSQRVVYANGLVGNGVPPLALRAREATGLLGPDVTSIAEADAERLIGERESLRLVTLPFRVEGDVLFLQVAAFEQTVSRSLGDYKDLLWIGLPAGLLAAGIAVWFISGRAVHPILEMSLAAREVSPTNPGARLRAGGASEEIAHLNEELNRALDRMEAGFRGQEQFIANVSHELETPISVMMTELQVLRSRKAPAADYLDFAESAEEELRRLMGLVDSFLKLARVHSGVEDFVLTDVPVQDIVLEAVQHCAPLAKLHGVRILPTVEPFEGDPMISGDPQLLRSIVDNLIRNAIRFSSVDDVVELVCSTTAGEARFVVRDRGPGLPDEFLDRVFERYSQVPSDSRRAQGTGLGLAIVREVTELHGGRVSARNNDDRGCAFTVTLPLAGASRLVPEPH